jgi:hypothetical protein
VFNLTGPEIISSVDGYGTDVDRLPPSNSSPPTSADTGAGDTAVDADASAAPEESGTTTDTTIPPSTGSDDVPADASSGT